MLTRKQILLALLALCFARLAPAACGSVNVPLTIQEALPPSTTGVSRAPGYLTMGIPLADCLGVTSTSQLGLGGSTMGQFRALGSWPSGNLKWVLLDAPVTSYVTGTPNTSITVVPGTGNFGGSNLATDGGSSITVNTGSATFTIVKANFDLFDSVVVGGTTLVASGASTGLALMGPTGGATVCPCSTLYTSRNDASSTAVIEENGPVRVVVKATGQLKDGSGNAYMRFTVRMFFYANRADAKVQVSLRNADYGTSNTFTTAYKGYSLFEARVTPALSGTKSFAFGNHTATATAGTFAGSEDAVLFQAYSNRQESCEWRGPDPRYSPRSYIARTLTSGSSCSSVWTYDQNGYKIWQGATNLQTGSNSQYPKGWGDLSDSGGNGVEAGVINMAGYWPKSVQFMAGGTEVRVGIWPDQALWGTGGQQYVSPWPQYTIHDLYYNFHKGALASRDGEFQKMQYPLLARTTLPILNASGVFPYPLLEGSVADAYYTSLGMGCCLHDASPFVYRSMAWPAPGGGNQAEMRWSNLLNFLQRGYTGRWIDSANFYRFQTEQVFPRSDQNGASAFNWRDSFVPPSALGLNGVPANVASLNSALNCDPGATGGCGRNWIEPVAEHAHWYGMTDYYFMTGDEAVREALVDGASDEFINPNITYVVNHSYVNTRAIGAAVMSATRLHNFFAAIGDTTNAAAAYTTIDAILAGQLYPELKVSGCGTSAIKGESRCRGIAAGPQDVDGANRVFKPLMHSILLEGLWEYLQERGPSWPNHQLLYDLMEGIANAMLNEGYVASGVTETNCTTGTGLAYELFMDKANTPADNLHPTCGQTVWFNFYVASKYGDPHLPWITKFQTHLKHVDRYSSPGAWAEYGSVFLEAVISEILNPEPYSLQDVPLTVTPLGGSNYQLSWTPPANGATQYILHNSPTTNPNPIVWSLGFDPGTNAYTTSPSTAEPWFAATNLTPPAPGCLTNSITVSGAATANFALKAYVPSTSICGATSGTPAFTLTGGTISGAQVTGGVGTK
jgi:hypothetical protein